MQLYMPTKKSRGVFDARLKTCVGGVTVFTKFDKCQALGIQQTWK